MSIDKPIQAGPVLNDDDDIPSLLYTDPEYVNAEVLALLNRAAIQVPIMNSVTGDISSVLPIAESEVILIDAGAHPKVRLQNTDSGLRFIFEVPGGIEGPAGPQGERGAQGEQGPQGEQGLTELHNASDVDFTTVEDGYSLVWDVSTSKWVGQPNASLDYIVVDSANFSEGRCYKPTLTGWVQAQDGVAYYSNSKLYFSNVVDIAGLNIGVTYYVQPDGGLGTTVTEYIAGIAINTTQLWLRFSTSLTHFVLEYNTSIPVNKCAIVNTDTGVFEVSQKGVGVSDGTLLIASGFCLLSGLVKGLNYYAQPDGSLGTSITEYPVGFAMTATLFYVDINGAKGTNLEYLGIMQEFYPMPSKSGEIRLKVHKPADATCVQIRRAGTPYAGEGRTNWGIAIANITDDSNYKNNNDWYTTTGLSVGAKYYFKAFPYKGTVYNETQGVNECSCFCRNGLAEWTMDGVSGNVILDSFGNSNYISHNNVVFEQFVIGNGATLSSAYAHRDKFLPSTWISFHAMIRFANTGTKYLFGENISIGSVNYGWVFTIDPSGNIKLITSNASTADGIIIASNALQINTTYALGITYNLSTGQAEVFVNGVYVGTNTATVVPDMTNVLKFYLGATYLTAGSELQTSDYIKIDQARIYAGQLTAADFALLYRGGAAC